MLEEDIVSFFKEETHGQITIIQSDWFHKRNAYKVAWEYN